MLLAAAVVLLLPSCYVTRTRVGGFSEEVKEDQTSTYIYAKGKQAYLFWGLIPLGRTSVATPADGVCEIKTQRRFFDGLLSTITAGIFSMQTIKVRATRAPKTDVSEVLTEAPDASPLTAMTE